MTDRNAIARTAAEQLRDYAEPMSRTPARSVWTA